MSATSPPAASWSTVVRALSSKPAPPSSSTAITASAKSSAARRWRSASRRQGGTAPASSPSVIPLISGGSPTGRRWPPTPGSPVPFRQRHWHRRQPRRALRRHRRAPRHQSSHGRPRPGCEHVVLDMATSIVAEGKIAAAANRAVETPNGLPVDRNGRPTSNPLDLYTDPPSALMPFGAHKGCGLSSSRLRGEVGLGGRRPIRRAPWTGRAGDHLPGFCLDRV